MTEPSYVSISKTYAEKIRSGAIPPGTQLPSYGEIAERNDVSEIVARKAIEFLQSQGLVRSMRRRGNFVTDRPNLTRVSPERQTEDPEVTFHKESEQDISVTRDVEQVPASAELAEIFGVQPGDALTHTVTRVTENRLPVSISDTYTPAGVSDASEAAEFEETVADQIPTPSHEEWLKTKPGNMVKTIHQRFYTADNRAIMVSDVSYPQYHYHAFKFRMKIEK